MNKMRKLAILSVIGTLIFASSYALAEKIVVKSDINAYIDYTPIRSYNVDGYTYVIAEDLRNYGFDVVWNADERTLEVARNVLATPVYSRALYEADCDIVNTRYQIHPTDIVTHWEGRVLNGYNIGGMTVIQIDELAECGHFLWDAEKT